MPNIFEYSRRIYRNRIVIVLVLAHAVEQNQGDDHKNNVGQPRAPEWMKDQGRHQKVTSDIQDVERDDDADTNGEATDTTGAFRDDSNRYAEEAKYQRGRWEGQVSIIFHHSPKRAGVFAVGFSEASSNLFLRGAFLGRRVTTEVQVDLDVIAGEGNLLGLVDLRRTAMNHAVLQLECDVVMLSIHENPIVFRHNDAGFIGEAFIRDEDAGSRTIRFGFWNINHHVRDRFVERAAFECEGELVLQEIERHLLQIERAPRLSPL